MARLAVRLTPRGGRDALEGWIEDEAGRPVLKARVSAAPTDGQANTALVRLIAGALGLPKSAVAIASGETSRLKILRVENLEEAELMRRLGAPGPSA